MGKIIIHYEKHYESFFGRYWGLILFPLLPFWLLARDDGMAGYLDIDGSTFKLKYKKKMHPQEIEISEGVHQIIYRKKSKFAIAFNLWTRSSGGTLDNVLDSMGAYDDYKLDGFELNFGSDTTVKLRAEGGVLRKCKIEDVENALPMPQVERYGAPPKAKRLNFGCLLPLFVAVGLMALGFYASNNSDKLIGMINGGNSGGSGNQLQTNNQIQTEDFGENTTQTQENSLNKKMFVRAEGGLNLREGPSAEHKFLFLLPERAEITVLKTENGWAFVQYEGNQGWCSLDYLVEDSALLDATKKDAKPEFSTMENSYTLEDLDAAYNASVQVIDSYFGKTTKGGRKDITVDNVVAFFEEAQTQFNYWAHFGTQFEKLSEPLSFNMPGATICMVEGNSYSTLEEVCDRYFSLFSDQVAKNCLDWSVYLFDGKLAVVTDGAGPEWRYISHSYQTEQISDTQINVIVTVKQYKNPNREIEDVIYTFPCVVEDGAWVFNEMKTIYS